MKSRTLTTSQFIEKAIKVHKLTYDYSEVDYKHTKIKIKIRCKIHGIFEQAPNNHLRGMGCTKCTKTKNRKKTPESILAKCKEVHGDLYDYSKTDFSKNVMDKNIIICKIHGEFHQTLNNHHNKLSKRGCPECKLIKIQNYNRNNPTGWSRMNWYKASKQSKRFDSFKVYIIQCKDKSTNEEFIKIGRTYNTIEKRFATKLQMPYEYTVLKIIEHENYDYIYELELKLKNKFKKYRYKPLKNFSGKFECYDLFVIKSLEI